MILWRKIASGLAALGMAIIGLLLASRRASPPDPKGEEEAATRQKEVDEVAQRQKAAEDGVAAEEHKQQAIAQSRAALDQQVAKVDSHVEGLSHDALASELKHALDDPANSALGVATPASPPKTPS